MRMANRPGGSSHAATIVRDIPAQDVITRDDVSMKVNAVVCHRVVIR
jgi:hypothetical protein